MLEKQKSAAAAQKPLRTAQNRRSGKTPGGFEKNGLVFKKAER